MRSLVVFLVLVIGASALKKCPDLETDKTDTGIYGIASVDPDMQRVTFTCNRKNTVVPISTTQIRINEEEFINNNDGKEVSVHLECRQGDGKWFYEGKEVKTISCQQHIAYHK